MDMPGRGLYDERDSGIARSGRLIRLRSKAQIDLSCCSFHSHSSRTRLWFWFYLRLKTPWEFALFVKAVTFFFPNKHIWFFSFALEKRSTRWSASTWRFKVKRVNCYTSPAYFNCCCFSCCHWYVEAHSEAPPLIMKAHRCLLSSSAGAWRVLGDGVELISLSNLERILTWNLEDDARMECLRGH